MTILSSAARTVVASLAVATLAAAPAGAAANRWNNTHARDSVRVTYCDGAVATLAKGTRTGRDVCKVWLPYNREIYAWVEETGTLLLDTAYCGSASGRWISFTSATDTSRTARVSLYSAQCA